MKSESTRPFHKHQNNEGSRLKVSNKRYNIKNTLIRKLLYISTLAIIALLTSCDSDGLGGTGMTPGTGTAQLSSMISRINTPLQDQGYSNFETTVITSQEKFDEFIAEVTRQDNWDNQSDFLQKIQSEEYDFTKSNLLLYRIIEPSPVIKLSPKDPVLERGKITIIINRQTGQPEINKNTNYVITYKILKTVQELLIKNGTKETIVRLANGKQRLKLSTLERKGLLQLFGVKAADWFKVGIRVIDTDGSGSLSKGDTAILAQGGASSVSQQTRVLSTADMSAIYNVKALLPEPFPPIDKALSPVSVTIIKEAPDQTVLQVLSTLTDENLYTNNFIANHSHIIAYQATNSLYIRNLRTPKDPFIAEELRIEDSSSYFHPIGDTLFLSINKEVTPSITKRRGDEQEAWNQGITLSLIDISTPAKPHKVHTITVKKKDTPSTTSYRSPSATGFYRFKIDVENQLIINQDETLISQKNMIEVQHVENSLREMEINNHPNYARF